MNTFKIGDVIEYKDVDMESYTRGYGIHYEMRTAKIVGICYKLDNGDVIEQSKLTLNTSRAETQKLPSNAQSPPAGQTG